MWVVWRIPAAGHVRPHRFTFRATKRGAAKAAELNNRLQRWPGFFYVARITEGRPPPGVTAPVGS